MPEAIPNKRYTGEFKREVIKRMHQEQLSMRETARMAYLTSIREYIRNEGFRDAAVSEAFFRNRVQFSAHQQMILGCTG